MSTLKLRERRKIVKNTAPNHDGDELRIVQEYLYFVSETIGEMKRLPFFRRGKVEMATLNDIQKKTDDMAIRVADKMSYLT